MPSSATSRNRFEKQGAGENANAWGTKLNATVFDLVDEALDGRTAFALSGSKTLSATNFASDEARRRVLDVTGGTGGTITIPAAEKLYLVRNASSGNAVLTTVSGATATIGAGLMALVFCDGTNVRVDGSAASSATSATEAAASAAAAAASAAAAAASEAAAETAEINAEAAEVQAEIAAAASSASASAAAASATNAAASVSAAANSAVDAAASATNAASSASMALIAETNAEAAEVDAQMAQAAAEAARDAAESHAAGIDPANLMHLTGAETAAGLKTFANGIAINGQTLSALSAPGKAIVEAATYAAIRALLDLEIGTDVQAWDALLDGIAALSLSGNGGKLLAVNSGASAFEFVGASSGWTQIAQVATTSGTTADFLNIPNAYSDLLLTFESISTDNTGGNLRVAVSADGSTFSTAIGIATATNPASLTICGAIHFANYNSSVGITSQAASTQVSWNSPAMFTAGVANDLAWRVVGGIQAIRLSTAAGNFDGGTATLFAR